MLALHELLFTPFSGAVFALGLAACVRAFRIFDRGVIFWDDGVRIQEVQYLTDLIKFIWNSDREHLLKKNSLKTGGLGFRGIPLFDANPMNISLYAGVALTGVSAENSALVVNVVLGIVGIVGVYAVSISMFDPQVAALAVLFLSVSGYHLLYSRSIHAEASCGTFYIWATYVFYQSYTSGSLTLLAMAGVLAGMAMACNMRHIYIPVFFVVYTAVISMDVNIDQFMSRIFLLGAGMAVPFVVFDLAIESLKVLGYPGESYLEQLGSHVFRGGGPFSLKLPYLQIFLWSFWELEGFMPLIGLVGCGLLVTDGSLRGIILASQVMVPVLIWSARVAPMTREGKLKPGFTHSVPRLMSSSIYALVIAAAAMVVTLPPVMAYLIVGIIVLMGLYRAVWILRMRSGFKSAIRYMADRGSLGHMSSCHPISSVYAEAANVGNLFPLNDKEFIEECRRRNLLYLLYVPAIHRYTFSSHRLNGVLERLLSWEKPVFTVPTGMIPFRAVYWDEHNNPESNVMRNNCIEIYDLRKYLSVDDSSVAASVVGSA